MNTIQPFYSDLKELVDRVRATTSPAEAHGILTGMFCVDLNAGCSQWLEAMLGEELNQVSQAERDEFEQLRHFARSQLSSEDFSFDLWLPDDSADLPERAEAVGAWCQGFLSGLGYQPGKGKWPGSCTEVIKDLAEIARIDRQPRNDDENEHAFVEIVEFVRAGVLLIQAELFESAGEGQLH